GDIAAALLRLPREDDEDERRGGDPQIPQDVDRQDPAWSSCRPRVDPEWRDDHEQIDQQEDRRDADLRADPPPWRIRRRPQTPDRQAVLGRTAVDDEGELLRPVRGSNAQRHRVTVRL